jgi:hypothetical protein
MSATSRFADAVACSENGQRPSQESLDELFAEAEPVDMEFLIGEWDGYAFGTDLPEERLLASINWVGKAFRSATDVDPIVCLDEGGARYRNDVAGSAHIEMLEFRGSMTATMVYDSGEMQDHFRKVDTATLLGAMVSSKSAAPGYFYLLRRGASTAS